MDSISNRDTLTHKIPKATVVEILLVDNEVRVKNFQERVAIFEELNRMLRLQIRFKFAVIFSLCPKILKQFAILTRS
jgi:hypothetical protein